MLEVNRKNRDQHFYRKQRRGKAGGETSDEKNPTNKFNQYNHHRSDRRERESHVPKHSGDAMKAIRENFLISVGKKHNPYDDTKHCKP